MLLKEIEKSLPKNIFEILSKDINELRPSQEKAINQGLFNNKNLLICTPTASGKTLIAELAFTKAIIEKKAKAIYIVPLIALANEKFHEFKKRYNDLFKIAISIGDFDSSDPYLIDYDLIICTSEKLDSLIRHQAQWLRFVNLVVIDEIHLLNDIERGPTLEIIITLLKQMINDVQIIGLSATIGNPKELANWLDAELVEDSWRPVPLHKGIYYNKEIEFEELN